MKSPPSGPKPARYLKLVKSDDPKLASIPLVTMNPTLSICIPTYNRHRYVAELLEELIRQIISDRLEASVEVVVSDNASTDDSGVAFARAAAHPFVRIHRLAQNEGADFNFHHVATLARHDFIWWCCSDDKPAPGALRRLLEVLRSGKPLYYLSYQVYDLHLREQLYLVPDRAHLGHRIAGEAGAVECGYLFGYLAALVMRRSAFQRINDPLRFRGSLYVHVDWVLALMCREGAELELVAEPLLMHRHGNDSFLQGNRLRRTMVDVLGYRVIGRAWLPSASFREFYRNVFRTHIAWALRAVAQEGWRGWLAAARISLRYFYLPGVTFNLRWLGGLLLLTPARRAQRSLRGLFSRLRSRSSGGPAAPAISSG